MKATNKGCPLMLDTCDGCGFYDIGNNLCEYSECLSYDENMEMIKEKKDVSTNQKV